MTREWEIVKTYIFDVALREGLIGLDWDDFETKAQGSIPAVAVRVDEPLPISALTEKAMAEVRKNIKGTLSSMMVVVSFKAGRELRMSELGGMSDCLSRLVAEHVDIIWGAQQADEIKNSRSVMVFAFEKEK